MSQAIAGVDHPVIVVRDLDAARSACQRLGFLTAPRGIQAEHVGTHSHAIMLDGDYVELLGVRAPTGLNEPLRRALERRQGIHYVALRTADVEAAVRDLRARGIAAGDPMTFSRPIDAPDGPAEVGFALSFIPDEAAPGATLFACQHLTPERVWLPALQRHPNTALRLDSVTVVVDDLPAAVERYGALFGPGSVAASDRVATVTPGGAGGGGGAPIVLLTPAVLAARYPGVDLLGGIAPPAAVGLAVRVRDPRAARVCLDDAGIVPIEAAATGGFCVAPRQTCGVLIEFRG